MKNIVLARVDDRLIHGQIMTGWSKVFKADTIMVVDDETYKDPYLTQILLMAVQKEFNIIVADVEKGAEYLLQGAEDERVLMLVKYPETIEMLIEKNVNIKALNVGGMGANTGRKTLYRNLSSSESENQTFRRLQERGVRVYVQIVPGDKEIEINKLL